MSNPPNLPAETSSETAFETVPGRFIRSPNRRYLETVPGKGGTYRLKKAGYKLLEAMSTGGQDLASMARALGITSETFRVLRQRDTAAQAAVDVGRAVLGDELTSLLLERARKGCVTSLIWLDKTRRGVSDTNPMEGVRTVVNQQFNINLPPAQSEEEYIRLVTGQEPAIEHADKETDQ